MIGSPGRGRLGDLCHVELAEDGQRERPRDRGRRHVQDVRRERRERLPLLDPEAVLLVDDGDGEVGEEDAALDQRVRPDRDLRRPVLDLGARHLRPAAAGQQDDPDAELGADPFDRQEVLLGERLGRRHQRRLSSGLDRAQKRVERDGGLARADVALQQPLHRLLACEVGVDLGERQLLVLGQGERQDSAVARGEQAGRRQGAPRLSLDARAEHGELQRDELVEREPLPRQLGLVEVGREVDRRERVAADRELDTSAGSGSSTSWTWRSSAERTSSRSRLEGTCSLAR